MSRLAIILSGLLLLACGFIYVARVPRWQALYADLGIPLPRAIAWCFLAAHAGAGYVLMLGAVAVVASLWVVHDPLHRTVIGVCALVVSCVLAILTYAALINPITTLITTTAGG